MGPPPLSTPLGPSALAYLVTASLDLKALGIESVPGVSPAKRMCLLGGNLAGWFLLLKLFLPLVVRGGSCSYYRERWNLFLEV